MSSIADNKSKYSVKSILHRGKSKGRICFPVLDTDGRDRTPKPLDASNIVVGKERQLKSTIGKNDDLKTLTTLAIKSTETFGTVGTTLKTEDVDLVKACRESRMFLESRDSTPLSRRSEENKTIREESMITISIPIPKKISLILNETDTIFILDLPSVAAIADSEEGRKIVEENQDYLYKTTGIGRNRRLIHQAVQTHSKLMKMRKTHCTPIIMKNTAAYVSNWEMYDTLHDVNNKDNLELHDDMSLESLGVYDEKSNETLKMSFDEYSMLKIVKNQKFQDALCVIERLLANNIFNEQQKIFWDLDESYTAFTDDEVQYKDSLYHLWSFGDENSHSSPVTAMEWNPYNKDILAVAHGKFYYTDWVTPELNIWNVKNPVNPERTYKFSIPITDLSFSRNSPNILAISFYTGYIILINIARRDLNIVAETNKLDKQLLSICSMVQFFDKKGSNENEEEFVATYKSGRVMLFKTTSSKQLKRRQIMCIPRYNGNMNGIDTARLCMPLSIPSTRFCGAMVFCQDPHDQNIYYIGANDGVVHVCSRNLLNQHIDMFLAHDGPVIAIKFHPYCHKIFFTCGSDMYSRLWCVGVHRPLLQYSLKLRTTIDFDFSPIHPTVGVSIRDQHIHVWDIQRKTFHAQYSCAIPNLKAKCTKVLFKEDGRCVLVGDSLGQVHVYALQNMPYPPFFPENLIMTCCKDILLNNPEVMEKLVAGLKRTKVKGRMQKVKTVVMPSGIDSEKCAKYKL